MSALHCPAPQGGHTAFAAPHSRPTPSRDLSCPGPSPAGPSRSAWISRTRCCSRCSPRLNFSSSCRRWKLRGRWQSWGRAEWGEQGWSWPRASGRPRKGAGTTHPLEHGGLLTLQDHFQDGHQPQWVPPVGILQGSQAQGISRAGREHPSPGPLPPRSCVSGPLPTRNGAKSVRLWGFMTQSMGQTTTRCCSDRANFQL